MKSSPSAGSKRAKTILPLLPRGFAAAATVTIAAIATARNPNAMSLRMVPPYFVGFDFDARTERSRKAPGRLALERFWSVRSYAHHRADGAPTEHRPRHGSRAVVSVTGRGDSRPGPARGPQQRRQRSSRRTEAADRACAAGSRRGEASLGR